MRITLIVPPGRGGDEIIVVPPMGLLYIAASLAKSGHSVEIIDAFAERLDFPAFEAQLKATKPDAIGISGMTPVWDLSRKAIKIARQHAPVLVAGGAHVSMRGAAVLDDEPELDYAVIGEGEQTAVELFDALASGRDPSEIPGVAARGKTFVQRKAIQDLDSISPPSRRLIDKNLYHYPLLGTGATATMFTSRGCPYGCVFCDKAVFGAKPRMHSAERVLSEMTEIVRGDGIKSIVIYDDLFTYSYERVMAICDGIMREKLDFAWKCEGRVDGVDEKMFVTMRKAGAKVIAFGIETVSEHGLKFLRKGTSREKIANALLLAKRAKMDTIGYFLLGIPGETWEDAMETVRFAVKHGVTWAQFSVLAPTPGTPLWGLAQEQGWYAEVDAKNPFDKDLRRPALLDGYWTEEKLQGVLKAAHRGFYMRPGYIFKRLADIRSIADLKRIAGAGLRLLKWFGKRS